MLKGLLVRSSVAAIFWALIGVGPVAGTETGTAGRAEPGIPQEALARAVNLHLENLSTLARLPAKGKGLEDFFKPEKRLSQLGDLQLQAAYVNGIAIPGASNLEQAAKSILFESAARPQIAASVRPVLGNSPLGQTAARELERWAAWVYGLGVRPPGSATPEALRAELANLLEGGFDSSPAIRPQGIDRPGYRLGEPSGPGLGQLVLAPRRLRPSIDRLDSWFDHPVDDPVSWIFSRLDIHKAEEILADMRATKPFKKFVRLFIAGQLPGLPQTVASGFKAQIKRFARPLHIYEGIGSYDGYRTLPELMNAYRERGVGEAALAEIMDHTTYADKRFLVEHSPRTWQSLTQEQRRQVRTRYKGQESYYRLRLRLGPADDLAAVARKYAAGRGPKILERKLIARLRASRSGRVSIRLEELLPPFVGDSLSEFEECTGPNCYNAADAFHKARRYERRYLTEEELLARLESSYRPVYPGQPILVGDVLVYRNPGKSEIVHAADYVGDGFVFTKNGASRFAPYAYEQAGSLERGYFPSGRFEMSVFRRR